MQFLPDLLAYEWVLVIDIDEFFVFNPSMFSSISDYLEWQETQPVDAIGLSWLIYGPNKQGLMSDEPVHRRFTESLTSVDRHVKSVFKPRLFGHSHCHFPIWDDFITWNFRCSDRRPHPKRREANGSAFSPHPRAEFAWINHYIMKSAEEFILRRSNPRGDGPASSMLPLDVFTHTHVRWFRDFYESTDGTQDSRIRDCCPGFDAEYNRLKSLPGVIRACGLIAAAMAKRRAELLDLLRGSDRFSVAGSDEEWFGSLLLERQFAG